MAVSDYVQAALSSMEPLFLAVSPLQIGRLTGLDDPIITVADMAELGRNPARLIPAARAFADAYPGQRVRYLCEPAWPSRSAAEMREAARHDALINLAFAGTAATIMCPYSAAELPRSVIAGARRTHPAVIDQGRERASRSYLGSAGIPPGSDRPLSRPPARAGILRYKSDLRPLRSMVASAAQQAKLPAWRVSDLVLAVSELAANSLQHARGGGEARLWRTRNELVCEVHDRGCITDPLAGRRTPAGDRPGGHGLWLVNQVCDLVELRTSAAGTSIRLHMRLRHQGRRRG
jgi:anti-sigma regulatory factor (Ser/Thr protein kinase)